MSQINNFQIDISQVKSLNDDPRIKPVHVSELPDDMFQRVLEAQQQMLEMKYSKVINLEGNPTYKTYANVVVNGKIVAEIDNHGFTKTSNALGAKIQKNLPTEGAEGQISGPGLAKARAKYIAEMMGGEIVVADTALNQYQFNAIAQPEMKLDREAMERDPAYHELLSIQERRSGFLNRQIEQQNEKFEIGSEEKQGEETQYDSAAQEFMDYMDLTPEQRYFKAFLDRHDMTQEQFDALADDEKQAWLEKFKEEIKRKIISDKKDVEIVSKAAI